MMEVLSIAKKKLKHPEVAPRLRGIRRKRKISQEYIANLLGIGVPKVINIENGRDEFDPRDVEVLLEHFGIEGTPLTNEQVAYCMKRAIYLSSALAAGNFAEAKIAMEELEPVLNLEGTDSELVML